MSRMQLAVNDPRPRIDLRDERIIETAARDSHRPRHEPDGRLRTVIALATPSLPDLGRMTPPQRGGG
jgi:hypothetical protein